MRLAALFLGVLAASVLLASLAAWGITYGTSSSRVTLMSSDFTAIAGLAVDQFQAFVSDLLLGNANLVNAILAEERESGEARLQEAQATMVRTTGTLVNYTANATDQSQAQVNAVVDTFASLMGSVVVDFKGVATGYAGQLRAALAAKASTALLQTLTTRNATMLRFQMLYSMGLLNLSKAPWEPIGLDDCTLLGVLCAATLEMSTAEPVTIALATGRSYTCQTGQEASVTRLILNGTQYTQQSLKWLPDSTALGTKQRCFTKLPVVVTLGQNCTLPPGCGCGQDLRCEMWYTGHAADVRPSPIKGDVFRLPSGVPATFISYSLFSLDAVPALIAVASNNLAFAGIDAYLAAMVTVAGTTLVNVHNDTYLSVVGTTGAKCAANATPPGDTSIPTWSGLRSCDPGLRAVCQWLAEHRGAMPAAVSLNISDVVWDVFLTDLGFMAYYVIVGTPLAVINAAVDASDARTAAQLTVVRAEQLSVVAASGAATKAYMAAVGAENVHASQGMQQTFAAQIQALENSSKETLAVSQRHSATQVAELTQRQTTEISSVTARHLSAMAVTTGWTLGVVFGILLGVLLCSAWGTVRLTLSLANIIHLMEDVADMRVEDLVVPQHARVAEVARIEAAFQVLVRRLVQYKSYIPAGVFEQMRREEAAAQPPVNESEAEGPSVSDRTSMRRLSSPVRDGKARGPVSPAAHGTLGTMHALRSPGGSSPGSSASGRNPAAHRVAALCFHAFDLTGHVVLMPPAQAKALLSQYTVLVHEAVSQNRGNVDFLAGDQAVVTFNAHIPCADPGAAAVNAACEMRRLLQQSEQSECLRFQIGIAFGPVLAGSVGYAKFRSMVTLGIPMKIAAMISQMSGFDSGTILADASVEERLKYAYELHPADLVHFPQSQTLDNTLKRRTVFLVQAKRQMDEDEWLYQLGTAPVTEWAETFERIAAAPAAEEAQGHLEQFLAAHPRDPVALRLKGRLAAWTPGLGLPLWDRAEHAEAGKPPALPK